MKLSVNLIPKFKHKAPKKTFYKVEEFKKNTFSIWICYDRKFGYNDGKRVCCIWGFYDYKKCKFYSPINSSKIGKEVNFEDTSPWSSMRINYQGVERFFV